MAHRKKLTSGRRLPFSPCGHRGLGIRCHRCEQGQELETRAGMLEVFLKSPKDGSALDKFCFITTETSSKPFYNIVGGARRFTGTEPKKILEQMRQESKRLLSKTE